MKYSDLIWRWIFKPTNTWMLKYLLPNKYRRAWKNPMSQSSITKDCYNRRAVKHTYICIYIKIYIYVYPTEEQYYATKELTVGTDHTTAGQAGPALPGAAIHTAHQAEHSKQLPPKSSKATKLCPDTSSTNTGSLTNIFDHTCGQMRVEPGQKRFWADTPTPIYYFSSQKTCCPLVPGVVVSWSSIPFTSPTAAFSLSLKVRARHG